MIQGHQALSGTGDPSLNDAGVLARVKLIQCSNRAQRMEDRVIGAIYGCTVAAVAEVLFCGC